MFIGLAGYQLINDALGNIVFSLDEVSIDHIIEEYHGEILSAFAASGAPGNWAGNLDGAAAALRSEGMKGFILNQSFGMSGWLIAQTATATQQGAALDA